MKDSSPEQTTTSVGSLNGLSVMSPTSEIQKRLRELEALSSTSPMDEAEIAALRIYMRGREDEDDLDRLIRGSSSY